MSTLPTTPAGPPTGKEGKDVPADLAHTSGFSATEVLDDQIEKKIDEIEMLGEEQAAGLPAPGGHSEVTAGMRYLH